ncbi:hypothetical protein DL95DRAFT_300826, partial [Leptodontidium sp. 2 PMI_412]
MGSIYHGQGKFGLAVDTMRKVVEGFQEQLGPDHLTTISAMESLAGSLVMQGALSEALETSVLVSGHELLGESHPNTVSARVALCSALRVKGELQQAEDICVKALKTLEHMYGKNHPVTLAALARLA